MNCSCQLHTPAGRKGVRAWFQPAAIKGLVLFVVLAGGLAVVYLSPLREQLKHVYAIREMILSTGWAAPVVFIGLTAFLVAIGCPRLLICPVSGICFGFAYGLLLAQAGTVLGAYISFLIVRLLGRDLVLDKWPRLKRFTPLFKSRGIPAVFLVRQMPVGGFYISILLGLSPVRHRDFLIGTALGILPEAIPATLIGSETFTSSISRAIPVVFACVAALVLIWAVIAFYRCSSRSDNLLCLDNMFGPEKHRDLSEIKGTESPMQSRQV